MNAIAIRLAAIQTRVRGACDRSGRNVERVRVVAASKGVAAERIRAAFGCGVTLCGENYVQEALYKMAALADLDISWHFIGHLQSNKAKFAAGAFSWIHTLDRPSLAAALDHQAHKRSLQIPVLIQVNLGGEESKSGVAPQALLPFYRSLVPMEGIVPRGLMALPPFCANREDARPYFRQLAQLLDHLHQAGAHPDTVSELSMGMSHDFEVAVEEGATLIRIGTALFGERPGAAGTHR